LIFPANRIVCNYGKEEGLYLIGARRVDDGYDYSHRYLQVLARYHEFPLVPIHEEKSIESLLPLIATEKGVEGWVIRFPDGFRVKVKTEEYVKLHKLVTNLTPSRIRDMMLVGNATLDDFLSQLPDEVHKEAMRMADDIRTYVDDEEKRLTALYQRLAPLAQDSRKAFALEVMAHHRDDSKYLFTLLDGRGIAHLILKSMELTDIEKEYDV
jgi:RNA ligase